LHVDVLGQSSSVATPEQEQETWQACLDVNEVRAQLWRWSGLPEISKVCQSRMDSGWKRVVPAHQPGECELAEVCEAKTVSPTPMVARRSPAVHGECGDVGSLERGSILTYCFNCLVNGVGCSLVNASKLMHTLVVGSEKVRSRWETWDVGLNPWHPTLAYWPEFCTPLVARCHSIVAVPVKA